MVYTFLTALVTGIFVFLVLVGYSIVREVSGFNSLWTISVGAFVIALTFHPLRRRIQSFVDKVLFREHFDYQRILAKYSDALAQPMTELTRFSRLAPYLLTKSMKLLGVSFMVLDREAHCYVVRAGEREAAELEGASVAETSSFVQELITHKKPLILREVENQGLTEIAAEMKRLKALLIIPSISESEYFKKPTLLATINLGKKSSGLPYSEEDIGFLKTLANQAAISIEYAFIFEELKKNQARVVQSEKMAAIGATTAGVAHELKNPLTYLSTVAQILPKKWSDPEFRHSVDKMLLPEVQRMQLIIEGLLDYSRSRELKLEALDIKSVIDKTIALLNYDIIKNKVPVKTDFSHTAKVLADPNRLIQVFMNLVANGVQAMEGREAVLSIRTKDEGGMVSVSVMDTGAGIPRDKVDQIFDSFFTTKDSGTGLGLAISKKIVDEHKGTVSVDSILGKGTTITVCLPKAA
ncbi:ATP-binding protein [Candidatus Margulisiibacteriota bacterium]